MSADGKTLRQVTSSTAFEAVPSWSPDGKWLTYQSNQSGVFEVWVIPAAGGRGQQLSQMGNVYCPVWSPDGDHISYHQTEHPELDEESDIWMTDVRGVEKWMAGVTSRRISGQVTVVAGGDSSTAVPLPGAVVTVEGLEFSNRVKHRLKSDAKGHYEVWVEEGLHRVTTMGSHPVELSPDQDWDGVNLSIQPTRHLDELGLRQLAIEVGASTSYDAIEKARRHDNLFSSLEQSQVEVVLDGGTTLEGDLVDEDEDFIKIREASRQVVLVNKRNIVYLREAAGSEAQ